MSWAIYQNFLADDGMFDALDELADDLPHRLRTVPDTGVNASAVSPSHPPGSTSSRLTADAPFRIRAGLHLNGSADCCPDQPAVRIVNGRRLCTHCLHPDFKEPT